MATHDDEVEILLDDKEEDIRKKNVRFANRQQVLLWKFIQKYIFREGIQF